MVITTRLTVSPDGAISAATPLPAGEYEAAVTLQPAPVVPASSEAELWASIHALQEEATRLPVLDARSPEEILGYNAGDFTHTDIRPTLAP